MTGVRTLETIEVDTGAAGGDSRLRDYLQRRRIQAMLIARPTSRMSCRA